METYDNKQMAELKQNEHYFRHIYYVVLAWKLICEYMISHDLITEEEFRKINHLIAWHDNSKISEEERCGYQKLYLKNKSEEEKREVLSAIYHHKKNNLHHYESLKDYHGDDWKCYVIELICDYIAMGWELENSLFEYYEEFKEKIDLPKEYKEYLENVLNILKESCYDEIQHPLSRELENKLFSQ